MSLGAGGLLISILVYVLGAAVAVLVLYLVIRFAVRAGVEEALDRHELRKTNWRAGDD